MEQYTEQTSFWLKGLDIALGAIPQEQRQEAFDAYIEGKDITRYAEGLRAISEKYALNSNARAISAMQVTVKQWVAEDIDLSDLQGSVLLDIFYRGKLEKLKNFEEFRSEIESQGSLVAYSHEAGIISVHNGGNEVPIQVLGRAHRWAHENELDHVYK